MMYSYCFYFYSFVSERYTFNDVSSENLIATISDIMAFLYIKLRPHVKLLFMKNSNSQKPLRDDNEGPVAISTVIWIQAVSRTNALMNKKATLGSVKHVRKLL